MIKWKNTFAVLLAAALVLPGAAAVRGSALSDGEGYEELLGTEEAPGIINETGAADVLSETGADGVTVGTETAEQTGETETSGQTEETDTAGETQEPGAGEITVETEAGGNTETEGLGDELLSAFEDENAEETAAEEILLHSGELLTADAGLSEDGVLPEGGISLDAGLSGRLTIVVQKRPVTVTAMDQTTALNGAVQTGPEYAVLEGAVEGHTLAEISLTADPAAYAGTFRESITPSGAKIVDENGQDVTENYAVTYVKGSLTVEKGSISFVPPTAKDLTADGTDMELVEGGYADGGFLYYALGSNELEEPAPDQYSPYVPEAAAPGTYYVWCKAVGDASHEDSAAVCVTATVKISVPKTVITGLFDAGSGNLRFYWRSLGDQVDGYQIRWSLTRDMSAKVKTASYTGKNRATRPGLLLGQTYYCNVRTYKYVDGVKQYSIWSGTKQIVLKRTLPAPRLISAQSGNGGLRTEWDTAEGVDGYQIQYCEDPSFHGAKSASVKNPLKSAFTKKNLSGGTTWYVRVRSYKRLEGDGRRYYSAWSEVYTVEM